MEINGIGKNNIIHPTAIIGPNVILGDNNYIGPYCYISGNTIIGNNNRFEAYCSVGLNPETVNYFDVEGKTIIGDNNIIRDYCSIHAGSINTTIIGNNILILHNSHIAHDCIVDNKCIITGNVILGGFCHIMEGVNLGMGTIIHQRSKIGAYSMIGMGAIVTSKTKIKPGGVYFGNPAKFIKPNTFGLEKNKVSSQYLEKLIKLYNSED